MKHLFFLASLLLACGPVQAQSIGLKVYGGLRSESEYRFIGDDFGYAPQLPNNKNMRVQSDVRQSLFVMPALAFEQKNGNFAEISFVSKNASSGTAIFFQVDTSTTPRTSTLLVYGAARNKGFDLQLGYHFRLNRKCESGYWRPSLGALLNFSNSSFTFTPQLGDIYARERTTRGVSLGFVPSIKYLITDQWFLDFNATFFVFTVDLEHSADRNPLLTPRQQESDLISFGLFEKYWLRVGAGWQIPLKKKK